MGIVVNGMGIVVNGMVGARQAASTAHLFSRMQCEGLVSRERLSLLPSVRQIFQTEGDDNVVELNISIG